MKASEFITRLGPRGFSTWEQAAVELARNGDIPEIQWVPIPLSDGVHSATIYVSDDYFTVGEGGDNLRLPLTPSKAQDIANLKGALLPTPWLVYRIWQESQKLGRRPMVPNRGANLAQYSEHDAIVNKQIHDLGGRDIRKPLSGHKKDVVVSNAYKPGRVVIFGWYAPDLPDVFNDKQPWNTPNPKQPQQALSNVHGAEYVDYSHGIRFIHPIMKVDGHDVMTEDVYTSPNLSRLVSHEGPIRTPRYPSKVPVLPLRPAPVAQIYPVPNVPGFADKGLKHWIEQSYTK
jgi:hypothetical protein